VRESVVPAIVEPVVDAMQMGLGRQVGCRARLAADGKSVKTSLAANKLARLSFLQHPAVNEVFYSTSSTLVHSWYYCN
jgi:hypothetical protein